MKNQYYMKTLKDRINESTLLDIKKYIKDEMQSDYTYALDLLKSTNSATNVIIGANSYIKNTKNPLKNDGYYLAMLFESSGLSAKDNINIIKNIIEKNNQLTNNELNIFLHAVLDFNNISDKRAEKMLVINDKKDENNKNYIHNFLENTAAGNNIFTAYCQGFENLAKYIYNITTFIKPERNKTNGIGNGELLLQLLFGSHNSDNNISGDANVKIDDNSVNKDNITGDVHVKIDDKPVIIEIKSGKAALGSSEITNRVISNKFLKEVKNILNKQDIGSLRGELKNIILQNNKVIKKLRIQNAENASIMNQFEYDTLNGIMELAKDSKEKEKLFNCFVYVILSRYISDKKKYKLVCNALKSYDSYYRTKIIDGKILKDDIKYFVGLLHIIGYKLQKEFKYLCVTSNNGKFYTINCNTIEDIINTFIDFTNISSIVDFERSSDSSDRRTHVYQIFMKK